MNRILRAVFVLLTMPFDFLIDGRFRVRDHKIDLSIDGHPEQVDEDYLNKLDSDNKREIKTFDEDGIVGVTIIANGSKIQIHGYLLCSEYKWKNATFPSCQHVLIGASFVLAPQLESIKVCLKGNPFSKPCQSMDNIRYVDTENLGFIHPRYEPQFRVGDIAVLRLDEGLNNPIDDSTKWVYPTNIIKLEEKPEEYYGFVSHRRGVTRWKETMDEKNTTLMSPFKDKHPYPVLDVCKNVSNAPRYFYGHSLGPWREKQSFWQADYAPLGPRTTYIFASIVMSDNRHNLFPDHGLLINMEHNTVMGIFSFEDALFWQATSTFSTSYPGQADHHVHKWQNPKFRHLLNDEHNDIDLRINVHYFSIVSYYLPWIYIMVKIDTEDLMIGDTDEEAATTTSSSSSTGGVTEEITTPIPELPDIYYDDSRAFDGVVFVANPCGKAVSHLQLPSALWTTAICCSTLLFSTRIPTNS